MKNIIYKTADDATKFDIARYQKSLKKYADVPEDAIREAIKSVDQYENMHVSVLVELGASLISKYGDEKSAEKYLAAHNEYFDGTMFERLRRITGYLVGTLDRWNDGKKAEEAVRVKHSVNSSIDDNARAAALETQALARNIAYAQ